MVILLVIAAVFLTGVLCTTALHFRSHRARLRDLETIVHVNGIRGKSTVTRLIHGALHESGRTTVAKTTGTYACVLAPDKSEHPIMRRYAPNILEQFSIFGKWINKSVNAMVVECMAVRPEYQKFCQDKIVRADIVVITNVRIDHTEEMGETLEEIAKSLCSTMPRGGVVVTGEHNPDVLEVMRAECEKANTRLIVADTDQVSDEHVGAYRYLQFKENVAVGLEICKLLDIDTETALRGMLAAEPDPGMVTVDTIPIDGKRVHWVPAFAVNDKESTISVLDEVDNMLPEGCPKIGLLNNRSDRGTRAELFAEIVCEDVDHHFAKLALLGDLERPVAEKIVGNGWEDEDVLRLGAATNPSRAELLDSLVHSVPGDDVAIVGMVNIHSAQAEMLIEYFENAEKVPFESAGRQPEGPDEQLIQAKLDRELLSEYEHEFAEYGVDVHDEDDMAALGITTPAPKTEFIKFEAALKVLARRQKVKAGQN
ncbi:poly-gamma-glutamate synthase PgsB [Dietzia timorensis]|uniref:PGA synthase CapB n=1 Tax=Dietzia timorensis TaxID=499555 RepID=A0A173LNV1_9ACTN|nr:poly-gamma-glutamate synthase PgsB [Dietzia timorensis]ANI93583.1 PGA synthase CapB [Dietzia timorensis]